MRFSDKLLKQRKNNNLSQEQLAEKLGVSRQAVSKWESGSSYPDMDKIIKMCSILNCTLGDLLDDGIIGEEHSTKSKVNIQNYMKNFLQIITRIINMFLAMSFKEKVKCIFEMIFYFLLLLGFGSIIYALLNYLTISILSILPMRIAMSINSILSLIYIVILLVLGVIIFIHLFKIRYLDYFVTIEDSNVKEKTIEDPIEKKEDKNYVQQPKEKVIIRDQKHSSFSFVNLLWKLVIYTVKVIVGFLQVIAIFAFIVLIMCLIFFLFLSKYNLIFFYIALTLASVSVIAYLVIYYFHHFILNKSTTIKQPFLIFCVSLIVTGVSLGLIVTKLTQFNYIQTFDDLKYKTNQETYKYEDYDEATIFALKRNVNYVIDNSLTDSFIVEITQPEIFDYEDYYYTNYVDSKQTTNLNIYVSQSSLFPKLYNQLIQDFKNNAIRNYNTLEVTHITIYIHEDKLSMIKINDH